MEQIINLLPNFPKHFQTNHYNWLSSTLKKNDFLLTLRSDLPQNTNITLAPSHSSTQSTPQTKDEYMLVLTLTDGKLGEGNFITQSMLLLVEDINDNVPVFKPHPTSITIREGAGPGILTTLEATDLDEGAHGQVVYHLQELDGDNDVFSVATVNGKAVVRLVGQLDYERKYLYQLRILAVDRAINEKVG